MSNDFDPNSHKNLELFRYYLNRGLQKIESSIQDNHGELLGYFTASLVDIFIVSLFGDNLKCTENILKIMYIAGLIILFFIISCVVNKIARFRRIRRKESGREEYIVDEAKQKMIDSFDNIACDGLLICESYMGKYSLADKPYVRDFYFFEVIHHLTKSTDLFGEIYSHRDLYVSSKKAELIDTYRVNNYIDFARKINEFLNKEMSKYMADTEVKKDIENLNIEIAKWHYVNESGREIDDDKLNRARLK